MTFTEWVKLLLALYVIGIGGFLFLSRYGGL